MKKSVMLIFLALLLNQYVSGQVVETTGRIGNSIYMFEDQQKTNGDVEATSITRLYQTLRVTTKFKALAKLKLNVNGRALTEIGNSDLADENRFRAYRLSISGNNLLSNQLDFEIGRQFLHPGLVLGSIDGANIVYRSSSDIGIQVYGGIESHLLKALNVYEPDDALVFGGSLRYNNLFNTNMRAVYLQKQSDGEAIWQIAGLNLANHSIQNLTISIQSHYDIVNSRLHRFYASTSYKLNNLSANIYYKLQQPQIYGNSYFQIFDIHSYQLSGVNLAYAISDNYAFCASMQGIQLKEGFGNRYIVSIDDKNGSLGIIYETGDLGEQLGVMLDYGYEVLPKLTASFSVDYSRYRFEEVYEFDKQLANAIRLNYKYSANWRFDLEYQWLNNRYVESDHRFLNHIYFIW